VSADPTPLDVTAAAHAALAEQTAARIAAIREAEAAANTAARATGGAR
jgi:hypothetical protein